MSAGGAPAACVLDTGVVIGWFVDEADGGPKGAPAARALLEAAGDGRLELLAPQLLLAECANVLWKLVRLRGYPAVGAARALRALLDAPLSIVPMQAEIERALALAASQGITAYDALYVALAERAGVPLITTDARLVRRLEPDRPWIRLLAEL